MVRFLSFLTALILMAPLGLAAQPGPPAGGERERAAHPPIHVRGAATTSPTGYVPSQIRHAYGFDVLTQDGAGQIVAIVDAYDDPTAADDLQTFIQTFGVREMYGLPTAPYPFNTSCTVTSGPHPCFQKAYAQTKPKRNAGWALEMSLDVQWSHAIAPGADILLVEARDASLGNLLGAVSVAATPVASGGYGAQVVSMSWGTYEFSFEALFDIYFNYNGVTFVAASGDTGTPLWPAASSYVVGVGGTTLPLDGSGNLTSPEIVWSNSYGSSGGGISPYEGEPGYQSNYTIPYTGGLRGIPDVSYDGDPTTGVSIFDSTSYSGQTGWFTVGGTSIGAPQWAALIALADQARFLVGKSTLSSNNTASSPLYFAASPPLSATYSLNYRDITSGSNTNGFSAAAGYDFVTGVGSPLANNLVPYLVSY